MTAEFDAVIVAGGRGARLGGVSKPDLTLGGGRLLDRALDAVAGARTVVVVGDVRVPSGVLVTREDPPGTGPAAGAVAGLAAIPDRAPWTLLLACDLPDAAAAVAELLAAAPDDGVDGVCLTDPAGRPQWLLGLYRTPALAGAANAYGDPANRSVRGLLAPLRLAGVRPRTASVDDLDTWADYDRWIDRLSEGVPMAGPDADRPRWRPFIDDACAAVGVDARLVDEDAVLDLARVIAHDSARPMAPVGAFILGLAVGAASPGADVAGLRDRVAAASRGVE